MLRIFVPHANLLFGRYSVSSYSVSSYSISKGIAGSARSGPMAV
jgi:hypothetical protein